MLINRIKEGLFVVNKKEVINMKKIINKALLGVLSACLIGGNINISAQAKK